MAAGWYRFAEWIVRKIGVRALVSLFILAMVLGTISSGLNRIVRDLQIHTLTLTTFAALLITWMLARSHIKGWLAGLAAAITGLAITLVASGGLNQALLEFVYATGRLANAAVYWRIDGPPPDLRPLFLSLLDLGQASSVVLYQWATWIADLLGRNPAYNRLAVSFSWGLVLWGIAAWASWAVRRREQPLLGLLPATGVFAASLAYSRASPSYLLPVIVGAFLLMSWIHFNNCQRAWLERSADYAEDIYFDLSLWVLAFTLGISSLALVASSVSPQAILIFTQQLVQTRSQHGEQVGASLGLEANPAAQTGTRGLGAQGLPRQRLLGSGPELSRQAVMSVQVDTPSTTVNNAYGSAPPYYWRVLTYDIYTSYGWATSETSAQDYPANSSLQPSSTPLSQFEQFTFRPLEDLGGYIYTSGELISVDRDYRVDQRASPPGVVDIFDATLETHQADQAYTVQSMRPQVGEIQLRAAGNRYPQWIVERYLQLPEAFPNRVVDLAHNLTANASNPYDQAKAIESYLRTITYTLDVPLPPVGQDVVDYFLFDLHEGYCDYYATSMVVLARVIGLPARLVVGYAEGTYHEASNSYSVTEADAHSWAEVYFPGIGWVEFEPTGGRPPIDRPLDQPLIEIPPPETITPTPASIRPAWLSWIGRGLALLACLALAWFAWQIGAAWRLRRLPASVVITRLYRNLYQQGQRLEVPASPGATPHEFAEALGRRIANLRTPGNWQESLSIVPSDARHLADLYNRTIYSPRPPSIIEQRQAIHIWDRLRPRLWLAQWLQQAQRRSHQS
jgi:transglutaminase-like putative cysteine protease